MTQSQNAAIYLITKYVLQAKQNELIVRARTEDILMEVLNSNPVSKEDKLLVLEMIS